MSEAAVETAGAERTAPYPCRPDPRGFSHPFFFLLSPLLTGGLTGHMILPIPSAPAWGIQPIDF
jgi:hypothetical protein